MIRLGYGAGGEVAGAGSAARAGAAAVGAEEWRPAKRLAGVGAAPARAGRRPPASPPTRRVVQAVAPGGGHAVEQPVAVVKAPALRTEGAGAGLFGGHPRVRRAGWGDNSRSPWSRRVPCSRIMVVKRARHDSSGSIHTRGRWGWGCAGTNAAAAAARVRTRGNRGRHPGRQARGSRLQLAGQLGEALQAQQVEQDDACTGRRARRPLRWRAMSTRAGRAMRGNTSADGGPRIFDCVQWVEQGGAWGRRGVEWVCASPGRAHAP